MAELSQVPLEERPLEICERKGLGHPDTMCDAIMNQVSVDLSKEYLRRFGTILHHNLDKGLLAAGATRVNFGGGEVIEPILIIYGDRATFEAKGEAIPVNEIAIRSTKEWMRKNLRFVDPDIHVTYQSQIRPGSQALQDIFERRGKFLGANDTSAAVGFAPYTPMERLILDLEGHLNSKEFKRSYPESGEDVKLMGLRKNGELNLTVAMAFVDRFVDGEDDYFKKRAEITDAMQAYIR